MKWLKYHHRTVNGHGEEVLTPMMVPDDENGRIMAGNEACGDIEEYDDGMEETSAPTQLDIIEAQVTYTAMMTDTLLEV